MIRWRLLTIGLSAALSLGAAAPSAAQMSKSAFEAAQKRLERLAHLGAPTAADGLRYRSARERLPPLGFDPLPIVDRRLETCQMAAYGDHCALWPEVETCSGAGDCIFFWRRRSDGRLLLVQTRDTRHGDIVVGARWGTRSTLCEYTFPPGVTIQALPDVIPPVDPSKPCGPAQEVR